MAKTKSNACGITGLSLGWFIPLAGLVLGIIALGRKEPNKAYGVLSIIESAFFWLVWLAIFTGL